MKKKLLLAFILIIQNVCAQIVSYDNSFASTGKYTVTASINTSYRKKIIKNTDGSIYFTYARDNASLGSPECVISKLNPNGTLDSSFGNNGETVISNYYAGVDSQLTKQTDGKLLIYDFNTDGSVIVRVLPNGQLDTAFGINGVSKIANVYTDFNSYGYGLYLQNNKIIIYGLSTDEQSNFYKSIHRLNNDGNIDTTFGNNGSINTMGNFVFLDSQSNIITLISDHSYTNANTTYPNGGLEKYNGNGQPLTSFGNNGTLAFTTSPGMVGTAFMDSNNNIICYNMNNEIFRINSIGAYDSSFVFDSSNSYPFTITNISSVVEKNGNYYIAGQTGSMGETFFISKLTPTGAVDPIFNYYSETTASSEGIGDMIINNNNIIAERGTTILKFLLSNPTLSTLDKEKSNQDITFENPVKQNLVFTTKDKVNKIEIYSADGKFLKTIQDNNTDVSELSKGIYIAKITFKNRKSVTKKLIKD
ncbi:putative delta-60 repeat protein [Chryseobacterium sp. H1D6B]|uniref:T9SS type A sorting domain-containing protein n=1 Tax=Chryseobacterium sp. H1D6B TaxID=2940588 RepID=UPI0015CD4110|nr:T9SS type A sorting domain-containing protein [Chryseobacterium sp. H1D6B]MDH6252762.1 putative delta-60 repeat protein [Chryseobacterium sp. H1D6B]